MYVYDDQKARRVVVVVVVVGLGSARGQALLHAGSFAGGLQHAQVTPHGSTGEPSTWQ